MSKEPDLPRSIQNHPLRKDIDMKLMAGCSINALDRWLRDNGHPSSRKTLQRYKKWVEFHADTTFVQIATVDELSVSRAEGMGAAKVNEISFLNDVISMGATANMEGIDDATRVKLGMQAIGIKETLLSKREDLQDKKRIELLESLLTKLVEGGLNELLVGLKAEVLEEQRIQREKDEAIDAEYTVHKDDEDGKESSVGVG